MGIGEVLEDVLKFWACIGSVIVALLVGAAFLIGRVIGKRKG